MGERLPRRQRRCARSRNRLASPHHSAFSPSCRCCISKGASRFQCLLAVPTSSVALDLLLGRQCLVLGLTLYAFACLHPHSRLRSIVRSPYRSVKIHNQAIEYVIFPARIFFRIQDVCSGRAAAASDWPNCLPNDARRSSILGAHFDN